LLVPVDRGVLLDPLSLPDEPLFPITVGFSAGNGSVAGCCFFTIDSGAGCIMPKSDGSVGTAFRITGLDWSLAVAEDATLPRPLERAGDISVNKSGEEAGDTGETKVSITGVLMSSF
jgi:hypothetical protein